MRIDEIVRMQAGFEQTKKGKNAGKNIGKEITENTGKFRMLGNIPIEL